MATNTKAPVQKQPVSNNSIKYSVGSREAKGTPTSLSAGGLNKISGKDPTCGTGGGGRP
jgi:hypothetical protein